MSALNEMYGNGQEDSDSDSVVTNTDTEEAEAEAEGEQEEDHSDAAAIDEDEAIELSQMAEFKPMEFTPLTMGPSIEDIMAKSKAVAAQEEEEKEEEQQREQHVAESLEALDVMDPVAIAGDLLATGTYEDEGEETPKKKKKKKKRKSKEEGDIPSAMLDPEDENRGERRVSWAENLHSFSDDEEFDVPPYDDDYTPPSEEDDYSSEEESPKKKKKKKKRKKKKKKKKQREEDNYEEDESEPSYMVAPMALPELETDDSDSEQQGTEEVQRNAPDESEEDTEKEEERFDDEYRDEDERYQQLDESQSSQGSEDSRKRNGILGLFMAKENNQKRDVDPPSVDISDLSPQDKDENSSTKDSDEIEDTRAIGLGAEDKSSNSDQDDEEGSSRSRGSNDTLERDEEMGDVPPDPPLHSQQASGMMQSQRTCCNCILILLLLGAVVGASFLGAWLALEREDDRIIILPSWAPTAAPIGTPTTATPTGPTNGPSAAPTSSPSVAPTLPPGVTAAPVIATLAPTDLPGSAFDCPEGNSPLEFRITFDAQPADIGLRVIDSFGVSMWDFSPGSFGSFALLLRENIFTLCLSPFQTYTFEVIDANGDGLISNLGSVIYGSFALVYENQIVTTYDGDCVDGGAIECGEYCRCAYELRANGGGFFGNCTTECVR